jgi:hypothetical protein
MEGSGEAIECAADTTGQQDSREERAARWAARVEELRRKLYRTKDLLEESDERLDLLQEYCDGCEQSRYYEDIEQPELVMMGSEEEEKKKEEEGS